VTVAGRQLYRQTSCNKYAGRKKIRETERERDREREKKEGIGVEGDGSVWV
jgi:hypothetical protein